MKQKTRRVRQLKIRELQEAQGGLLLTDARLANPLLPAVPGVTQPGIASPLIPGQPVITPFATPPLTTLTTAPNLALPLPGQVLASPLGTIPVATPITAPITTPITAPVPAVPSLTGGLLPDYGTLDPLNAGLLSPALSSASLYGGLPFSDPSLLSSPLMMTGLLGMVGGAFGGIPGGVFGGMPGGVFGGTPVSYAGGYSPASAQGRYYDDFVDDGYDDDIG